MKRNLRRTLSVLLLVAGIAVLGIAGVFALQNEAEANRAAADASALLARTQALQQAALKEKKAPKPYRDLATAMADVQAQGLLGTISIPAFDIELPVQSEYEFEGLKESPMRYQGTGGEIARLVLCAHNYKAHFGRIGELQPGDEVDLTAMDGTSYKLQVSEVFTIGAWGAENLQTGDWDLSLFTCTPSGKNRVLVRCTLVDPAQLTQADA
ncbi:MAG: sortase [Pygmaiobacter sp.]|nr:sortase [Pygmaiobacter sp.]